VFVYVAAFCQLLMCLVDVYGLLNVLWSCRKHGSSFAGIFKQVDNGESAQR